MFKVIQVDIQENNLMDHAYAIRRLVFVEEQNVSREEEFDDKDGVSKHYLVQHNDQWIGTARWRFTENGIKLERFAILKEFRNKGAGKEILNAILKDVSSLHEVVYLHAQESALEFYKKHGFEIKGERFFEANIPHFKMFLAIR